MIVNIFRKVYTKAVFCKKVLNEVINTIDPKKRRIIQSPKRIIKNCL